eukprot:2244125-Rhodomonas_salina.2
MEVLAPPKPATAPAANPLMGMGGGSSSAFRARPPAIALLTTSSRPQLGGVQDTGCREPPQVEERQQKTLPIS